MPQFIAISREQPCRQKMATLQRLRFCFDSTVAPIVGVEIARAALAMPLAFVQEADASSGGGAIVHARPQHAGSA